MYSENPAHDIKLFAKAFLSNQLARFAPALWVKLTGQTGRGADEPDTSEIADYFLSCFREHFQQLGLDEAGAAGFLTGKRVLEYGPGDILGVALLMYAHGAEAVYCVDRFPLQATSAKNVEVYRKLLALLEGPARARAERAFTVPGQPESGFNPAAIAYLVTPDGLSGRSREFDLIISRAVLEHVNDLDKTLADIAAALKPGGVSIHQVDLKSHGLDRYRAYDFLTWPSALYGLMYSHKGFPNRWRIDKYRESVQLAGLVASKLEPIGRVAPEDIAFIRPHVDRRFRALPPDELAWLGFWMVLAHDDSAAIHSPAKAPA